MATGEEIQLEAKANVLVENNLSKVKIIHGSKKTTWEISVKHEDPMKAKEVAVSIDADLRRQYEG